MTVLVIADHDNAALKAATLHAVTAAASSARSISWSPAAMPAAPPGPRRWSMACPRCCWPTHRPMRMGCPRTWHSWRLTSDRGYSQVLAPATSFGKNLLPRVAALLDSQQISEIIGIDSPDTFQRPIYAGNAIATVQSSDTVKVITVRGTAFEAASAEGGSAPIEPVAVGADTDLSRFIGQELSKSERPELTSARSSCREAEVWARGENFAMLNALADKLGRRSAPAGPRWTPGLCRTTTRSGRPARSWPGTLHRGRHLRCDPASGRHEGQQGHRRHQQGRGGADFSGR